MTERVRVWYVGGPKPVSVGLLAQGPRGALVFQYDGEFADRGIELSPLHLPTSNRLLVPGTGRESGLNGLHTLFADSLPDGWGRRLMDYAFEKEGRGSPRTPPLTRLCALGARAMGALVYEPDAETKSRTTPLKERGAALGRSLVWPSAGATVSGPAISSPAISGSTLSGTAATGSAAPRSPYSPLPIDLAQLAAAAERVFHDAPTPEPDIDLLIQTGAPPGGARPKALIGVRTDDDGMVSNDLVAGDGPLPPGYTHWLVKFPMPDHGRDEGRVEAAYADMARAAGIDMPRTRLFSAGKLRCFGVERFDRQSSPGGQRLHTHTLAGVLGVGLAEAVLDYDHLIRVTLRVVRDHRASLEIVRRMVFNVLAHNRDDHGKNHAFRMDASGRWSLSPAYDILYSDGPGGEHQMSVAGEGRAPTIAHLRRIAEVGQVSQGEFDAIVEKVRAAVASWGQFADQYEVPPSRRAEIRARHQRVAQQCGVSTEKRRTRPQQASP